jgi:NTE family protein
VSRWNRLVRALRTFAYEGRPKLALPAAPAARPRIGLALGGGFARAMAHIGVLKVLEQENIRIDFVGGTSAGAIVGAMYCSGLTPREMENMARTVRFRDFARWTLSRYGFCSNDRMAGFLARAVKVQRFEDLRIPLAVAATDFCSGQEVIFRRGPLLGAIRASCANPGMFQPVEVDGRLLVDGLLVHPVPTEPVRRMGADRVIAVHLSSRGILDEAPRHLFEVIGQCFTIAQQKMVSAWKAHADVVIQPDVEDFTYDAFERAPEMIRIGEAAARAALPQIRNWLATPAPRVRDVGTAASSVEQSLAGG